MAYQRLQTALLVVLSMATIIMAAYIVKTRHSAISNKNQITASEMVPEIDSRKIPNAIVKVKTDLLVSNSHNKNENQGKENSGVVEFRGIKTNLRFE